MVLIEPAAGPPSDRLRFQSIGRQALFPRGEVPGPGPRRGLGGGELLEAGLSRHTINAALAKGQLLRPSRGVIAFPDAAPLVVRCLTTNSLLTCVSAARQHGLWVREDHDAVHVLRADGRFRSERAVVHRRPWEPAAPGSRISSLVDTVMHALLCLPDLEALVIVEPAVNQRLSLELVESLLTGPGNSAARAVLRMVDRGADSLAETLARGHLRRAGFFVEPQVEVSGVGHMDHIVERCRDLKIDGKTHQRPERRHNDYGRDAVAQGFGFATLRATYSDAVHRPEQMVRRVHKIVDRRLAQGKLPPY